MCATCTCTHAHTRARRHCLNHLFLADLHKDQSCKHTQHTAYIPATLKQQHMKHLHLFAHFLTFTGSKAELCNHLKKLPATATDAERITNIATFLTSFWYLSFLSTGNMFVCSCVLIAYVCYTCSFILPAQIACYPLAFHCWAQPMTF
jgi:hypothetical protein